MTYFCKNGYGPIKECSYEDFENMKKQILPYECALCDGDFAKPTTRIELIYKNEAVYIDVCDKCLEPYDKIDELIAHKYIQEKLEEYISLVLKQQ